MGLTLSPELNGFVSLLGVPWPNIDEDEIRLDADAWRIVQAGAEPASAEADTDVRGTRDVYSGDSATELAGHWNQVGGNEGHLTQTALASKVAPMALDGAAGVVSAVKLAVGMQAAAGLTAVAQTLAFGGALGVTAATARMYLTRHAMGKVLREGSEGTGKVLGPAVARRVTDPMRRVLDNLRRPGGPGGTPALAGAGGRMPLRPTVLRNPGGPRSVRDGIANFARKKGNSGGRGGGGRRGGSSSGRPGMFRRDQTGKMHGDLPNSAANMSKEEAQRVEKEMQKSLDRRNREQDRLGYEAGHEERIRREKDALRRFQEDMRRRGLN
ncbi:hypothetical protein FAF44_22200 [Nonomuraea sp. MG754425]|uniref:WXG100-like domain-containing protein n=1 Tax=Nonomuraea sp. MG754425 TaxID=2570319 RepID=UPI001F2421AD|nr:hypothetical protein [Nonomuraea sp. MG754425]MCF6471090.1 hypothetical protein [Nonomuraea sp. MG754425]